MKITPEQEYRIDERLSQIPAALQRSEDANYRGGYFFVTLNVHDRLPILGSMTNVDVRRTKLGDSVLQCWNQIPNFHPQVTLIDAVVMPEHFHGLLYLGIPSSKNPSPGTPPVGIPPKRPEHLGQIINGFKIGCTHAYWDILGIPWRNMQGRRDNHADTHWTDPQHQRSLRGPSVFVHSYNDTIPITPEEVETKIAYIRSNPERRIIKGNRKDCFSVYRNQRSQNWTFARARQGLLSDRYLSQSPESLEQAWQSVLPRLQVTYPSNGPQELRLSYVGKRDILLSTRKLPLVCHRADEPQRQRQIDAVLREARQGTVIVSAFISQRERDIRDLLLQEGHPVVEILDNGMSPVYKPSGSRFYYCAEGRLLQITCWQYLYQRDSTITRPQCMIMNELARVISGSEDDWWKY